MKQRLQRKSDNTRLTRLLVLVVGVLVLGWLLPRVYTTVSALVLYPVERTVLWWEETTLAIPALWRDKLELQAEVTELSRQLENQTDPGIARDRLLAENQRLRGLLGADVTERVAAVVTARPRVLPYDVLRIDQGSTAGIEVGAPVYRTGEEVIGLVSQVQRSSALVTLFTAPEFSTTAYLAGTDLFVTLEGLGGGVARVLVPQGIPLQTGDLVYVPSIQPGLYGRIAYVESEPTQAQQFGYIVGAESLNQMRYVSVGQPSAIVAEEDLVRTYVETINQTLDLPDIPLVTDTATSTATSSATTTNLVESL